jgi:hypothetical protein
MLSVFENRVLRKMSGPKREEETRGWRRLHNELHDLSCTPNFIMVIKSRRMRYVGLAARKCFGGET